MTKTFEGRVAVLTGGASGIGRASALAFAARGAFVALSDIDERGGSETVEHIQQQGGKARFHRVDVTEHDAVTTWIQGVHREYGRIDFALNNAGIVGSMAHHTATTPTELWHRILDINLSGVWYCMRAQLPLMAEQGHGVIVNMASIAGLKGFPGNAAYAASKHAVVGLTRSAALEYVTSGVRINAICPGFTDTALVAFAVDETPGLDEAIASQTPAGRMATADEIATSVMYVCSDDTAFMIGQTIVLDGGISAG